MKNGPNRGKAQRGGKQPRNQGLQVAGLDLSTFSISSCVESGRPWISTSRACRRLSAVAVAALLLQPSWQSSAMVAAALRLQPSWQSSPMAAVTLRLQPS